MKTNAERGKGSSDEGNYHCLNRISKREKRCQRKKPKKKKRGKSLPRGKGGDGLQRHGEKISQ